MLLTRDGAVVLVEKNEMGSAGARVDRARLVLQLTLGQQISRCFGLGGLGGLGDHSYTLVSGCHLVASGTGAIVAACNFLEPVRIVRVDNELGRHLLEGQLTRLLGVSGGPRGWIRGPRRRCSGGSWGSIWCMTGHKAAHQFLI